MEKKTNVVIAGTRLVGLTDVVPNEDTYAPAGKLVECLGDPGKLNWARLLNGMATTGRPLPTASTTRPSGSVSEIPAAHLAIVLQVAGATIIASADGRSSDVLGSLYAERTVWPVLVVSASTSMKRRPSGEAWAERHPTDPS